MPTCAAGIGLFILAISPFFNWVTFGAIGVMGLSGDGKIVFGVTLLAAATFAFALARGQWVAPILLGVQAWGTLAVFWMGALIWKVGSVLTSSPELKDNPFAVMLAVQIGPGAGLYLGMIGGIVVSAALGYVTLRRLSASGGLKPYYATQALSFALGILLAFFVGPDRPSKAKSTGTKEVIPAFPSFSIADQMPVIEDPEEEWRKKHNVSTAKWEEMIANFTARKLPESVTAKEWWEEAEDKTPAQLDEAYPPLKPREWYRAAWAGGFSKSRRLDDIYSTGRRKHCLYMTLYIRTEPDLVIKELHGHLKVLKNEKIIYETQIKEKPDLSFKDGCFVSQTIRPYDDNNEAHRTLRYAKDSELTPVFTVARVVLADGTEKTFD